MDAPEPMTPEERVEALFTYHAPDVAQTLAYGQIRQAAKELARVIIHTTPQCADQSAALRHLREAVMTANAAIALRGLV